MVHGDLPRQHPFELPWPCAGKLSTRVRQHRASKPQGSSERVLPWQITMDQLIFASLSQTHYWYEVGMLKVPAVCRVVGERGQLMVRQNALKIRPWADVLRLESGVTTEGWTSLFRNTQLLHIICYIAPIGYIIPIHPRSSIA